MKKLLLSGGFILLVNAVSAQKDTARKINTRPLTTTNTLTPAGVRMRETEKLLKQMEVKLGEMTSLADKLKDQKDSISEMNQQDMLMLQRLMEKKNQLEQMISNVMKAALEGMQAAIKSLKAS